MGYETEKLDVESCQEMVQLHAVLRQKHKLLVVMRDNAGEKKSQEIIVFIESIGIKILIQELLQHEQWQNGLPESAVNSIMMISRTIMVEVYRGTLAGLKILVQTCNDRL
jgi:hypothetical protein